MNTETEPIGPPCIGPACLADDFEIYNLDTDYSIQIEKGPHFLIEFPVDANKPAAAFEHPNCARKVARTLHYKYDHPKRWVEKPGIGFFFVVPRGYITLHPIKGYSWPHGEINGAKVRFNCSGGSGGTGWRDWLKIQTSVSTNYGVRTLNRVAEVSVRGTPFEPVFTPEELEEQFYQKHGKDWLVTCAFGDWRVGVPRGMVGVEARVGGHRAELTSPVKYFLVPQEEYNQRHLSFVIDLSRHQQVTKFPEDRYSKTPEEEAAEAAIAAENAANLAAA